MGRSSFSTLKKELRPFYSNPKSFALWQAGVVGLDSLSGFSHLTPGPSNAAIDSITRLFSDAPAASLQTQDSGHNPIFADSLTINEGYKLFMMFNPGGDSISVPLGIAGWQWQANVGYDKHGNLILNSKSSSADTTGAPTLKFPSWTYVINPTDIRKI